MFSSHLPFHSQQVTKGGQEMKFRNEIKLAVPAEEAWELVGNQFGNIGDWLVALRSSKLEGTLKAGAYRICQTNGFGPFGKTKIKEKLIEFSPENHTFTYVAVEGIPWFIKHAQNTWTIEATSPNSCIMRFDATIKTLWYMKPMEWLMPFMMEKDKQRLSEELKYRIESGEVHPRKLAAIASYS